MHPKNKTSPNWNVNLIDNRIVLNKKTTKPYLKNHFIISLDILDHFFILFSKFITTNSSCLEKHKILDNIIVIM